MPKQNVIIFSSSKSLPIVEALEKELQKSPLIEAVCWEKYFKLAYTLEFRETSYYPLFRFLTKRIPSFDFAIVVAGRDDTILKNVAAEKNKEITSNDVQNAKQTFLGMRDNVVFELGMCCMALGESRVILLRQEGVRLLDDLRNNADLHKLDSGKGQCPALTIENIQLKAFEFVSENKGISEAGRGIIEYIEKMVDHYAPVVVGASCSTAQGYMDNFIKAFYNAFQDFLSEKREGEPSLRLSDMTNQDIRKIDKLVIHALIPTASACERCETLLSNARAASAQMYCNFKGINKEGSIKDKKGRTISFAYKCVGTTLHVIDIPTTFQSSYKMALEILNIEDNAYDKSEKKRYIAKEINMFKSTLRRLMADEKIDARVCLEDYSLDPETDRKKLPWLYD